MSNERELESFEDWHKRVKWPSLPSAFQAGAEWQRSQSAPADLRQIHGLILNALDRDAAEGKAARGEMAQELRAAIAAQAQSAPAGWQLVKVNDAFDTLVNALERADRKGYLADSLIEPWEAFDYEYVAATPKAEPQLVSDEVPCSTHPDAPHGFNRNGSHSLDRYVCDCEGWVPLPAPPEVKP